MLLVGSLALSQQKSSLLLTYQGNGSYLGTGIQSEDVPLIREEMGNLIKKGYTPILVEGDWEVIWLYLNDPYTPIDSIEIDFESDYLDTIQDLFPIKPSKRIKKILSKKWDKKKVMDVLGIRYLVEDDEVISLINYKKFEKYL